MYAFGTIHYELIVVHVKKEDCFSPQLCLCKEHIMVSKLARC